MHSFHPGPAIGRAWIPSAAKAQSSEKMENTRHGHGIIFSKRFFARRRDALLTSAVILPDDRRRWTMKKWVILSFLGMVFLSSMSCTAFSFLAPTATPTITLTPTLTPTFTPTLTATPSPTKTRTLTPTKIVGIEAPVMVGETSMQFRKALRRAVYECGTTTHPADNPDTQEYLLLTAKITSGPTVATAQDFDDWISRDNIGQIEVVDDANHYYDIVSFCYMMDSKKVMTQVTFAFMINKDAASFTVILPDDTRIPLDPLM
jgi:hypothetical protein